MNDIHDEDWYPTEEEMTALQPLAKADRPLAKAHEEKAIKRRGRPKLPNKKQTVSLRLDPDVIEAFRATGQGWQSRMNDVLQAHKPK